MNATNQCNSKDFILKPAEAQTLYVLLILLFLLVCKYYVNIYFQKTTFLQQGTIKSLFIFLAGSSFFIACSFWSLIIFRAWYLTCCDGFVSDFIIIIIIINFYSKFCLKALIK